MKRISIFLLILFTVSVSAAWAQKPWDSLKRLQPGQKIEVVDMNLKLLKGTFVNVSDAAIFLRTDASEIAIDRANVLRVSARGDKRGRNALIGLAIGAAGGAALGVGIMERESGYGGAVAGTTALFGAVGAGVGAACRGSRTVYRAPKREMASVR
jgi:hypothetical protein